MARGVCCARSDQPALDRIKDSLCAFRAGARRRRHAVQAGVEDKNFELFLACMDGLAREEQQASGGGEQAATAEGWHGTGGGAAVVEPEGPASGGRAGACSVQLVPADVYRALTGERGHRGGRGCGRPRGPGTGWTRWASRPDERCVRWQSRGRRARTCSSRQ